MPNSPDSNPAGTYDRVIAYACAYRGEAGTLDLDAQIEACRADARRNEALVVGETREEVRSRGTPLVKRAGLMGAIRRVRALGGRGVLVVAAPDRIGPSWLPVAIALVEDAGAGLASVQPLHCDRLDHFRLVERVDTLRRFADLREVLRREGDMVALRRTATWPLDAMPGTSPEAPQPEEE